MRTELVLGAAFFALILGASGEIEIDANLQTAGVGAAIGAIGAVGTAIIGAPILAGAAVGAVGGVVYSQLEEPTRISLC